MGTVWCMHWLASKICGDFYGSALSCGLFVIHMQLYCLNDKRRSFFGRHFKLAFMFFFLMMFLLLFCVSKWGGHSMLYEIALAYKYTFGFTIYFLSDSIHTVLVGWMVALKEKNQFHHRFYEKW